MGCCRRFPEVQIEALSLLNYVCPMKRGGVCGMVGIGDQTCDYERSELGQDRKSVAYGEVVQERKKQHGIISRKDKVL